MTGVPVRVSSKVFYSRICAGNHANSHRHTFRPTFEIKMNYSDRLKNIRGIAFDFDGVFTDNRVLVMESGEEAVFCDRSDGMGISLLRESQVPMVIISTEKNPVVSVRASKLRIPCEQGIDDKLSVLRKWATENGLDLSEIAFVGNDINDVECLKAVGLGVAVADAYEPAKSSAELVLTRPGGRGAVREFADLLLATR